MPVQDNLQSNTQHAVPQNIMDVEFKLIGDLTMRQFVYLLIFSGIAYSAYITNVPPLLKWPLIIVCIVAGLGFAFLPVEDRGLDEWIIYFFRAVYSENQMIWRKEPKPPSAFLQENISMVQQELITLAPTTSRRKLEQYLSAESDTREKDSFDQLEESYIMKVQEAFANVAPETSVILEEPEGLELPEFMEDTEENKDESIGEEKEMVEVEKEVVRKKPKPKIRVPRAAPEIMIEPITPDMHAGRKFTSMLPTQGTIVLPIRGEKVLKTSEQRQETEDASEKAEQLKAFIQQINPESALKDKKERAPQQRSEKELISKEAQRLIDQLQQENAELSTQIQGLKEGLSVGTEEQIQNKKSRIVELEGEMQEKTSTIVKLKEQISSLKPGMGEPEVPEAMQTKIGQIPDHLQPKTPNIVAGIIRNIQGRGISGVTLMIKNDKDDPVRALKTNELGEFSLTNPLPDGSYKIEVDINNVTSLRFDIINFEAKGEIIPAIEFVGK